MVGFGSILAPFSLTASALPAGYRTQRRRQLKKRQLHSLQRPLMMQMQSEAAPSAACSGVVACPLPPGDDLRNDDSAEANAVYTVATQTVRCNMLVLMFAGMLVLTTTLYISAWCQA